MVSVAEAIGLVVILLVNTAVAALMTRFFRVRLSTRWGSAVYAALLGPLALLVLTLVLGSFLGPNLGSPATVITVTIVLPLIVGITFDYFWMPAPDEVELPENV
ncbi:hypothetical protein VB773_02965 [Haloarculaceae archaeon H-GB2-1]|nr:hypothetical protein [Haloarculaceae archaeon H-GB1-1]MEA5406644.1 hypothetical protein [Haloarculaceae archaeon H-GB2-1]